MKKILMSITIALLPLIVLAGIGYAAPALARAERTALTGTETRFFGAPERVWTADGLTQIRGLELTGTFTFSGAGITLTGPETQIVNATIMANGDVVTSGKVTYTDQATGVTCTGTVIGKVTNALGTLKVNAPCSDGTHLQGTLQDVSTDPPGAVPPSSVTSSFTGELLSPGQN